MPSLLISRVSNLWRFKPDPIFLPGVFRHNIVVVSPPASAGAGDLCFHPMSFLTSLSKADNISLSWLSVLVKIWLPLNLFPIVLNIGVMFFLFLISIILICAMVIFLIICVLLISFITHVWFNFFIVHVIALYLLLFLLDLYPLLLFDVYFLLFLRTF